MSDPAADADRWVEEQMREAEQEMANIAQASQLVFAGPVQAYTKAVTALWRTDGRYATADQYLSTKYRASAAQTAIASALHDMLIDAGLPEELCDQIEETTKALIGTRWAKQLIASRQVPAAVVEPVEYIEDTRPF